MAAKGPVGRGIIVISGPEPPVGAGGPGVQESRPRAGVSEGSARRALPVPDRFTLFPALPSLPAGVFGPTAPLLLLEV